MCLFSKFLKSENFKIQQNLLSVEKKLSYEIANLKDQLEGQINKLKNGARKQKWSENDIAHSITLYSASAKGYKLFEKNNFPLPAIRTLQDWAQKI